MSVVFSRLNYPLIILPNTRGLAHNTLKGSQLLQRLLNFLRKVTDCVNRKELFLASSDKNDKTVCNAKNKNLQSKCFFNIFKFYQFLILSDLLVFGSSAKSSNLGKVQF